MRENNSKRKSSGFDLKPIAIAFAVIGLIATIYICYRASMTDEKLFSISLIALFCGLLFESFRVSNNWKNVLYTFIGAYLFSLINFLPGKREHDYIFENHIRTWPYTFIFFFTLAFAIFNKEKVTSKLTEGVTLILSMSLIYWCVDYKFTDYRNWFAISLLIITFILSAFSVLNAFTNIQLTRTNRLILSIWSTIIMFAFAVDNITRVFSNQDIETTLYLSQGFYIGIQYFLLGVSAVYIMKNYMLLAAFLPSKNGNYKNDLKENKKEHIERYSAEQVLIGDSLFCILYTGIIYSLNYKYQILPRHTIIWLVFLTFPLILQIRELITRKKNYS